MRKIHLSILLITALLMATIAPVYGAPPEQEPIKLKMGLLPILDVLPFYVAEEAGYFEDAGLDVELIPVSSALERDQLMIAGEVDGVLTDVINNAIFNQDEPFMQIVAQARRAYDESPQFRILAAPRSNITIPSDLVGVEIGISENSIIHYLTQRILENEGLAMNDIAVIPEPSIPVRFQLLMEGTLKAANLPDPLAQAAIEGGAILIADDSALVESQFSQSVLSFRLDVIEDKPEAVEAFLVAWMRAAEDINADPDAYRDLWLEKTIVPDSVKDTYMLPPFPTYAITDEGAWDDTVAWLLELDIVDAAASYEGSVNPAFIDAIKPNELPMSAGDAAHGEVLFNSLGCVGCHDVESDGQGAGPGLQGIAVRAGKTVEGTNAADYLHLSLVKPDAYILGGYSDIMPAYDTLPNEDVNDLVAYLLTLD